MDTGARAVRPGVWDGFIGWGTRALATGMIPGGVAGLIAGGVGSRLAMRVLALTSPSARGAVTEFGATVGEITVPGTIVLAVAGTVLGMLGGILFVAVRPVLPGRGWVQGLSYGGVLLALVGGLLVSPDNPDFVILSTPGLAVAMFSALPLVYGALLAVLVEAVEPRIAKVRRPIGLLLLVALGLVPLALAGGAGLIVVALLPLAWSVREALSPGRRRALALAGAVLLGALVVYRGTVYISGVLEII